MKDIPYPDGPDHRFEPLDTQPVKAFSVMRKVLLEFPRDPVTRLVVSGVFYSPAPDFFCYLKDLIGA